MPLNVAQQNLNAGSLSLSDTPVIEKAAVFQPPTLIVYRNTAFSRPERREKNNS
jgi:hypothetical protein